MGQRDLGINKVKQEAPGSKKDSWYFVTRKISSKSVQISNRLYT